MINEHFSRPILNTKLSTKSNDSYTKIFICWLKIFFQNKSGFKTMISKVIFQLEENMTTPTDVFQKVLRITTNILLNINVIFKVNAHQVKKQSFSSSIMIGVRIWEIMPLLKFSPVVCCFEPERSGDKESFYLLLPLDMLTGMPSWKWDRLIKALTSLCIFAVFKECSILGSSLMLRAPIILPLFFS